MTWAELIQRTAERAGCTPAQARAVLEALSAEALDALAGGEELPLRGVGALGSRWRRPRALRSVSTSQKLVLDGRFVPHFRPSAALRERLAARTPQRWRDARHQEAWALAEALVGDLALYHGAQAPANLDLDELDAEVHDRCLESFGGLWSQVQRTFQGEVSPEVRAEVDHLAQAARRRWARA